MDFTKQIAPFNWVDHEDASASVTLYASDKYKKKLFKTRKREGFKGSGYDWEALAQAFIQAKMPQLRQVIAFDSEHLMFCAISSDADALKSFISLFKETCENEKEIAEIFSHTAPQEPITKEAMQSVLNKMMSIDNTDKG